MDANIILYFSVFICRLQRDLKHHVHTVHERLWDNDFWCSICKISMEMRLQPKHIRKEHCSLKENGVVVCNVCHDHFKTMLQFVQHFMKHREYKVPRRCPICPNISFVTVAKYYSHLGNMHNKGLDSINSRKLMCKKCGWTTTCKDFLISHIRCGHYGDKFCRYCKKPQPAHQWLKHMKEEAENAGYFLNHDINIGRNGAVVNKSDKTIHRCEECFYIIGASGSSLLHHYNSHIKVPYSVPCPECGKKLPNEEAVRAHKKDMHAKAATCDHCGLIAKNKVSQTIN